MLCSVDLMRWAGGITYFRQQMAGEESSLVRNSVTPRERQRASLQRVGAEGKEKIHKGDRTRFQKDLGC